MTQTAPSTILVTGVTGYIGGQLVPRLLDEGYTVRAMTRGGRDRLAGRRWVDRIEVVKADVLEPDTLPAALEDVQAAYYLIHSMEGGDEFARQDLEAACHFARAAAQAGVQQIIYLSGLGDPDDDLSEHLRSRQETGRQLRQSGPVPVTEFRAAAVIGSGSLSFEILRYLTERIPFMICPKWVETCLQPIAVADVLDYLVAALVTPQSKNEIIEIGGSDVMSYRDMMQKYADFRHLKRLMIPVPFFTPRLSSYWVHIVTPVPASIAQPLIDGLRNEVIVRDSKARDIFPQIQPTDFMTALAVALKRVESGHVDSVWGDALVNMADPDPAVDVLLTEEQGMMIERREQLVDASPEQVYTAFTHIGGEKGWFRYHILWQLRGLFDRIIGGVGMRSRYLYSNRDLIQGQLLDFWRVEKLVPPQVMRLRAEMKLPGRGWLQFETEPAGAGRTKLTQTAFYAPRGLWGTLYWYILVPFHGLIFGNMSREIAQRAEALAQGKELDTVLTERKALTRKNLYALPLALGLPLAVGVAGALATSRSLDNWYRHLKKPAWNPPNAIFGPVWTTLYLMMGLASWLIWTRRDQDQAAADNALTWYGLQLGLNALWSPLFFGLRRPDLALFDIAALWSALLATLLKFSQVRQAAALLLVPYFLWVSFATALNAAIWWLNRKK
ncbi:MAG: DUF2867 domain-containing protein [Anaerolineae bacterium]|nr:DUF2867 domain-containing protein [Anaerolineae bacterium]